MREKLTSAHVRYAIENNLSIRGTGDSELQNPIRYSVENKIKIDGVDTLTWISNAFKNNTFNRETLANVSQCLSQYNKKPTIGEDPVIPSEKLSSDIKQYQDTTILSDTLPRLTAQHIKLALNEDRKFNDSSAKTSEEISLLTLAMKKNLKIDGQQPTIWAKEAIDQGFLSKTAGLQVTIEIHNHYGKGILPLTENHLKHALEHGISLNDVSDWKDTKLGPIACRKI